jgi:hypothetical protein
MSISIPINSIRIDGGTQIRVGPLDEDVVAEYAENIESLPPIDVFVDDAGVRWLADGFYRYAAHKLAGKASIQANQSRGSQRYALLHAVKANHQHGKRRSNADKRNAVMTMLGDAEWGKWIDTKIAAACAVTHQFVAKLRSEIDLANIKANDRNAANTSKAAHVTVTCAQINKTVSAAKTPVSATAPAACDPDDEEPGAEAQAAPATEPAAPAPSLDQVGRALPADAQGVIDAFAELPKFASIKARIGALKSELDQLAEGPAGRWVGVNEKDWKAHVQSLHRVIRYCAPYAVCPTCGGRKCETCKHTGYLPEEVFNALAPEVRGTTRKGGKAA